MEIKKTYVDFTEALFSLLTGGKYDNKNKSDYEDLTLYWCVEICKAVLTWILFPFFIVLPIIAFFFSISFALFIGFLYLIALLIGLLLRVKEFLVKKK